MIELCELRQFAAFADCGTLSEAAEVLRLSHPALRCNMEKTGGKIQRPFVPPQERPARTERKRVAFPKARERACPLQR